MSDSGYSATDIITYIGVPLAVLGVLPIMYNTFVTLVNASKIKRMLRHSRLTALTRSDVINRVIEIELPRYAVTPWDRFQDRQEYWQMARNPSSIPGGSWTTFNWKTNAIGFKTQRVEYADQLRQPQVEVGFDELISYLLDLGAVPDAHGWRLLRSTGMWTPVGCTLMRSPDELSPALSIAPLDDSDGNLSLSVTWRPEWTSRNFADLPPYWVSLPAPPPPEYEEADTAPESSSADSASADAQGKDKGKGKDKTETEPRASLDSTPASATAAPITCQISVEGIVTALAEEKRRAGGVARNGTLRAASTTASGPAPPAGTGLARAATFSHDSLYIEHIRVRTGETDGMWFASAATAYGTTGQTILWNYRIPQDILAFARRETVPCGVLVLLGAASDDETPEWATAHAHDSMHALDVFSQRNQERHMAMQAEMRLPPNQRDAAQRDRMQRESMQRLSDMRAQSQQAQERQAQREMEALNSAKWDTRLVAEHTLRWLRANSKVDARHETKQVAGHVLHRMVCDGQFAAQLCRMLDRWKTWSDLGGMKKADLQALRDQMETFCYATLLVALIKDTSTAHDGTLSIDLQECMRMWRKVRLG